MASEMLSSVSPQSNADPHSLTGPSSTSVGNSSFSLETKKDLSIDKICRSSSSGEEDGDLVIDTDDDNEKVNKDIKPFYGFQGINSERKSPIKNNNNNNSAGRGLCNNKHIGNVEKDSNKSLSANSSGSKLPSFMPTATGFGQSSKLSKTKSKKSAKSNKSNLSTSVANNTTSASSPSTSSPAGSFINALDTESIHLHNFDSKIVLPRASSSPDENAGKKSKPSKSKSHHKKQHSKHAEKSGLSTSGGSGKSENEKVKSKSKHSSANTATSSSAAFSFSPEASEQTPRSTSTLSARNTAEKIGSNFHLTSNQQLTDQMSHSASNTHRIHHLTNQGRVPARTASIAATVTGNGAKGTHAYSDRESSEVESPANQSGRKKQKKGQSGNSGGSSSREMAENTQTRDYNYQSSLGKRDRNASNAATIASANEGSKTKRMKFEQDLKSHPRISASESSRSGSHVAAAAENNQGLFGTGRNSSQVGLRTKNGENAPTSAGHSGADSGAKAVATRVFAPSSHFAQTLPRFNVSNPAEINSSSRSSKDTSSGRQGSAKVEQQKVTDSSQQTGTSLRSVGTITSTSDVGVMTETDSLGPCEPGTSVHLDGIVWHETDTGVLVVNVTWRNRTYMGTLLDATKHDWAPPRFSDSDLDMDLRGKNNRPKRTRGSQNDNNRKGRSRGATQSANDDIKNSPSAAAKRRNKNSESETASNADNDGASTPRSSAKRQRVATPRGAKELVSLPEDGKAESNGGSESSTCSSPVFLECPHPKCSKRFKQANALKYHQSYAHGGIIDEDTKETNGEETPSTEESSHDTPASDTDAREEDKSEESMKHPLADLVLPEDSQEGHYHKKKSYRAKDEEIKSPDQKSYSKDHPEASPPQKDPQRPHSLREDHAKTDPSNTIQVSGNSSAPHHHILPSDLSTSNSVLPNSAAPTSNRKEASHQHHNAEADMESAQAVKTLLQLQDTNADDYSSLPGLSAAYSQDSPHPTLSLVPRPAPPQDHSIPGTEYPSRTYSNPPIPLAPSMGDQKSFVPVGAGPPVTSGASAVSSASTDAHSMPSKHSAYRLQSGFPPPGPTFAPPVNTHLESVPGVHPPKEHTSEAFLKHTASSSLLSKENYTVSVSNATPAGIKIAKGKIVPVPLDPDHSIPSSYAGAASLSKDKKMKKKKKAEGKSSGSPEPSSSNEAAYTPLQEPVRMQHPTLEGMSYPSSTGQNILPASTVPVGGPPKPQIIPGGESSSGQPNDPNRRMHSQHQFGGSRKFPGIISPVSSSQTNYVTATGTFHPHPDPHKPQTAVSAQAQDRIRSSRPSSPNNSTNKNNNNKLGPIQGRPQNTPVSKPRPSSALSGSPQTEKPPYQDHESFASRPKVQEIKASSQLCEAPLNHIQNQVDNTIASAYSKELSANRTKPTSSSPLPGIARPRNSPIATRDSVVDPHSRPIIIKEETKPASQKNLLKSGAVRNAPEGIPEVRKSSPSPRPKSMADIQHLGPQQQAAYMPHLYGSQVYAGMGFVHSMDPTFQAAVHAQYMSDPALREQYERYLQGIHKQQLLQQQTLAQQQAQGDRVTRRPDEKEALKPSGIPADREQLANWQQLQQQHQKRTSVASPAPYQQQPKEKPQIPSLSSLPPHAVSGSYRSPQAHPQLSGVPDPTRSHSAAPSNPPHLQSRPHHVRSESLDRGRSSAREDRRIAKSTASPVVKSERSPEKAKENYPSRSSPTSAPGPLSYYPYTFFDPNRPGAAYPYPAGLAPHGYVLHPGAPVLHPQPGWIQGQPPLQGKQSPPLKSSKDNSPSRFRSPSKEDTKPVKEFSGHYTPKERTREASEIPPERKYSVSPDAKSIGAPPVSKKSVTVSSEIPTQMHHHTHHHIHGVIPQYFPTGAPVIGGPDAVPHYPVPYQKRERPIE